MFLTAQAVVMNFSDFSDTSLLTLNGGFTGNKHCGWYSVKTSSSTNLEIWALPLVLKQSMHLSNTLHVPCFNGGSTMYWLDLELTGSDPVTLELKDLGTN